MATALDQGSPPSRPGGQAPSATEILALKTRLLLDVVKTVAMIVGAVILFLIVQRPDSILNCEASRDTIARERAKLLLEWIREPDPLKRSEAFAVISAAYGESENQWLRSAEFILKQGAKYEALDALVQEKRRLLDNLQRQFAAEVLGQAGTRIAGYGPEARRLQYEIDKVDAEIAQLSPKTPARGPGPK